jgi:5-methylcytosine-specific restriction endonuclease McrA
MELMEIGATKKLSDADLTMTLKKAIAAERNNIATSIACLIEITARDLHTRMGASSLFVYLTRELRMSESSASKRCAAIRAVRDFPEILPLIQSGRLHLSNISLISRHLTHENAMRLIGLAQTETQRGLEKALAMEFPVAVKRDILRPVVCPSQRSTFAMRVGDTTRFDNCDDNGRDDHTGDRRTTGEKCGGLEGELFESKDDEMQSGVFALDGVAPQAALGVRVHATLDADAAAALEFLAGAMPGKSVSDILSLAVCELRRHRDAARRIHVNHKRVAKDKKPECEMLDREKLEHKKKLSGKNAPAKNVAAKDTAIKIAAEKCAAKKYAEPSKVSRYIPAALRRAVAQRDGYRCSYVPRGAAIDDVDGVDGVEVNDANVNGAGKMANGNSEAKRCEAIHRLEFDHVTPRAHGGQNTVDNLRLLCRAHNNLAAKDVMGKQFIESHYARG